MVMHEVQVELALGEDHDGLLMRPWAASRAGYRAWLGSLRLGSV
jgi:hypothetical protein